MPMSIVLRLFVSLVLLAPSLVLAATLETLGNGDNLSGIGVIRGWKCEAVGEITVVIDGGSPISMAYGNERPDVRNAGGCSSAHVGFVSIWNYGELDSGEHTAVAYDNGAEFARSIFTVVRASEESGYLQDVTAECTVPDFPDVGANARFEWNTGTQHLELAEVGPDVIVPVSTRYDGTWLVAFEIDEHIPEDCACFGTVGFDLQITNGSAFLEGADCEAGIDGFLSVVVDPYGSVYATWYYTLEESQDADLTWQTLGSMDGITVEDAAGLFMAGNWLQINGCRGTWGAALHP